MNRVNKQIALKLIQNNNLTELAKLANDVKFKIHKKSKLITFVIDRNINYTNVCECKCKFCAYYKDETSKEAYVLDYSTIKHKISELTAIGGTQVLLQGGLNKNIPLTYYLNLLSKINYDFPEINIHAFSAAEIHFIAKNNNLSIKELLTEFKEVGLSSIPGAGAEILSDKIREKISPNKISADKWLYVMEEAHSIGLNTTATMLFGLDETYEDIIEHLIKIRNLQDNSLKKGKGKFTAFIPWNFQPKNTELDFIEKASSFEYLKIVAISRIVLDNIQNIQASWVTQGLKIAQLSLSFGVNDFGGTMMEENVVKSAGIENKTNISEIIKYIKKANYIPAQRNTSYNLIKTYY